MNNRKLGTALAILAPVHRFTDAERTECNKTTSADYGAEGIFLGRLLERKLNKDGAYFTCRLDLNYLQTSGLATSKSKQTKYIGYWKAKQNNKMELPNPPREGETKQHDTFHIKLENLGKIDTAYKSNKGQPSWDDESFGTNELYEVSKDPSNPDEALLPVPENASVDKERTSKTNPAEEKEAGEADKDGYTLVGTGGKVRWEYVLTPDTTDDEIENTLTTKLLRAVSQVEKQLGITVQAEGVSLGPREQARRARDALVKEKQRAITKPGKEFRMLTRNIALDMDATVVQAPGLRVTEEEQSLANAGLLEFSFQVEFKLKPNVSEIAMFQEFVRKVVGAEPNTRFLPWYGEDSEMPEIDRTHLPFTTIKGRVRLRHYIGGFNRNRGKIYGRVKVQSKMAFAEMKDSIVDWLRQDLHWIKEDYIQARRVSNIGLLAGTHSVVDLKRTREALENAVEQEIQRKVKLDLRLRKVRCKNARGNSVMSAIYGVSVDARQVSEAVKGLRAALHCNCRPPTGRQMIFVTRSSNNEIIDEKTEATLTAHYEAMVNEKRLYRSLGVPLTQRVKLQKGPEVTLQQAICTIPGSEGRRLFTGVECMGNTATVVFTCHKKLIKEAKKTVSILHRVLQDILDEQSYGALVPGLSPKPTPEFEAMQKQENDYLDGYLNLNHYTEIELSKKRKMDDDTVGARTAMSGLTNVSPQSNQSTGTAWTKRRSVQQSQQPVDEPMDCDNAEPARIDDLAKESRQQKSEIENMSKELKQLQDNLKQLMATQHSQQEVNQRREQWETNLSAQFDAERQERRELSIEMRNFMRFWSNMAKPQMEQTPAPPANLGSTITQSTTEASAQIIPATQQGLYPDPPPHGSGRI